MTEQKQTIWTRPMVVFFAAFFCCVLWGSATPAIKSAYEMFRLGPEDTAARLVMAGLRFVIAGIMVIVFFSVAERRFLMPKKESFAKIPLLALFQSVGQPYFFFLSLVNTSGVRSSIINASGNFFAILFAAYVFRMEKMTLRKWAGCIAGVIGLVLLLGGFGAILDGTGFTLAGEGAMLAADAFYAMGSCLSKRFSRNENPVALCGYQFLCGGAILFLIGILSGGHLVFYNAGCVIVLLYMGFISAGAYALWGILLKYNPVSKISILGFLNPVMGVLLSAIFLGENREALSWNGLLALILVSLGIILVNRDPSVRKKRSAV